MELCIYKIREDINKYSTFSMLPRDISQQVFNELVYSRILNEVYLEAFRDCALQDLDLGEYPGLKDSWMDVISSQGPSLLSVDISCSEVTDSGLIPLKSCKNLQALNFNYCDQISDNGLAHISGLSNLTTLSFRRNNQITAQGLSAFAGLINLLKLDLERCPGIRGGLVHLKGLTKLESLNVKCCNCMTDADMKHLSGLNKLSLLNMEGCPVTAACLQTLAGFSEPLLLF